MATTRTTRDTRSLGDPVDWGGLRHAYGDAKDIPELLGQLSPDPSDDVWEELWSRVCHQGTVYSASFPVLPSLLDAARQWSPAERVMPLFLAASIVASNDVQGSRDALMAGLSPTVEKLHALAIETLDTPELDRTDRIYLLQSKLALSGDVIWGRNLEGLANGEFNGICKHCQADLYVVIGEDGFFVTAEDWVGAPQIEKSAITPSSSNDLRDVGAWLYGKCIEADDSELADWVCHLFGSTSCPSCHMKLNVSDTISQQTEQ